MSGNRDEGSRWMSWKAVSIYFALSISWMFVRSSTRGLGISTARYSLYMNSSQESSRIRFPSLRLPSGFRFTNCHLVIFSRT
ncbi:hypothetical protein LINGRAHAP2_LOCUS20813 [Linum grandiflorum]